MGGDFARVPKDSRLYLCYTDRHRNLSLSLARPMPFSTSANLDLETCNGSQSTDVLAALTCVDCAAPAVNFSVLEILCLKREVRSLDEY